LVSKIIYQHLGFVNQQEKFIPDNLELFKQAFKNMVGKRVAVTVERETKHRTLSQQGYYRAVVVPITALGLGYTDDEMHDVFRMQFLSVQKGKYITCRSTTELSTVEFAEYVDKCIMLAAENGVPIPPPKKVRVKE